MIGKSIRVQGIRIHIDVIMFPCIYVFMTENITNTELQFHPEKETELQ